MSATDLTQDELDGVAALLGVEGPLRASRISGGRSNLTYVVVDVEGSNRWVLRTPPRAGRTPSAHDVAREHRVTSALFAARVPVPEAVLLHEDDALLGVPFTVSAFVEGRAYRTRDDLAELDRSGLTAVTRSLLETLAALHRVDHVAAGLERYGRPDGYAARQLKRWTGQWGLVGDPRLRPLAGEVILGLDAAIGAMPEQQVACVVHGDYRIDNTLVADDAVAAIVDWELSTIGDPVADVAIMGAYRDPAFDLIVGEPSAWTSPWLPAADDLAQGYLDAGGHPLDHWATHQALAAFKVAVIAAGIDHRRRSGAASGPGYDTAGQAVPRYLELARAALPTRR